MSLLKNIIFFISLATCFSDASPSGAQSLRTGRYPGTYHTALFKDSDLNKCPREQHKKIMAPDNKVLALLCPQDYSKCMFYGSCLIDKVDGTRIGLSYYKYDEAADQSYFQKTDLSKCPYGYGYGKVSDTKAGLSCLIPYFSVSVDPLEHTLGEVIFIPSLKGLKLPGGQIHDGYFIVTDSSADALDTGYDQFDFFTGTHSHKDPKNAFLKTTLSHPDRTFPYEVITGPKAAEIHKKRNFKILKVFKGQFKSKNNEMIGN